MTEVILYNNVNTGAPSTITTSPYYDLTDFDEIVFTGGYNTETFNDCSLRIPASKFREGNQAILLVRISGQYVNYLYTATNMFRLADARSGAIRRIIGVKYHGGVSPHEPSPGIAVALAWNNIADLAALFEDYTPSEMKDTFLTLGTHAIVSTSGDTGIRYGGRSVNKKTNEPAYFAAIHHNNGWIQYMAISDISATAPTCSMMYPSYNETQFSFEYNGITWYGCWATGNSLPGVADDDTLPAFYSISPASTEDAIVCAKQIVDLYQPIIGRPSEYLSGT